MTYHSQRPQCPSLSPHVLLLIKHIYASGWFVRMENSKCTPNTNNYVQDMRLKSSKYLRTFSLNQTIRLSYEKGYVY